MPPASASTRRETSASSLTHATQLSAENHTHATSITEIGNQQMLRMLGLHAKLSISQPGDPEEFEADRAADAFVASANLAGMNTHFSVPRLARNCAQCAQEEERHLARKTEALAATNTASNRMGRISEAMHQSQSIPLPAKAKSEYERFFGSDLSLVRIHAGTPAQTASRELSAHAFAHGNDIYFAENRFDTQAESGRKLLAHELTHTIQQRGAPAVIHRAPAFGSMYQSPSGRVVSHGNVDYDTYEQSLGPIQASSQAPGAQHAFNPIEPITHDELMQVFKGVAKDIAAKKISATDFDQNYLDRMNDAFMTFKIDTVEAQASFLANAWNESDQFRFMTETEKSIQSNQPYQQDPTNIHINRSYLDCAAKRSAEVKAGKTPSDDEKCPGVINYEMGGSINPVGDWQKSFIGRGPIQVTHRHYYVQVIAVMQKRAEELEAQNKNSPEAAKLRTAIDKIARDPREAANPEYAFLFSAAFMKMPDDSGVTGDTKASAGQVTSWMGQQPTEAKKNKDAAYAAAHAVLMKKWEAQQARLKSSNAAMPK